MRNVLKNLVILALVSIMPWSLSYAGTKTTSTTTTLPTGNYCLAEYGSYYMELKFNGDQVRIYSVHVKDPGIPLDDWRPYKISPTHEITLTQEASVIGVYNPSNNTLKLTNTTSVPQWGLPDTPYTFSPQVCGSKTQ